MAGRVQPDGAVLLGDRYRVVGELGVGGMGVVYEALDEQLQRRVALKMLHPTGDVAPDSVARLEREARAAARLGHPNIVRVLDVGRLSDGAFLVMELLTGETLHDRLDRVGTLAPAQAIRVHLQLLDALAAAHDEGVLHRDVKPSNVFLTALADGAELVKLLDFGIAYLLEEKGSAKLTATGIALGTPAYMAPERVRGEAVLDPRADLYSVGVSLFECLSGKLPFVADTPIALRGRILLERAPSLRELRPEVSSGIAEAVARALAKEPAERFEDARAMAEALRACAAAGEEEAPAPGAATQLGPFVERPERVELASRETMPALSTAVTRASPAHAGASPADGSRTGPLGQPSQERSVEASAADPKGAPLGSDTLPFGGRTRPPPAQGSDASIAPLRTARSTTRNWIIGLGGGLAVGALVLAALWAAHRGASGEPGVPGAAQPGAPAVSESVRPPRAERTAAEPPPVGPTETAPSEPAPTEITPPPAEREIAPRPAPSEAARVEAPSEPEPRRPRQPRRGRDGARSSGSSPAAAERPPPRRAEPVNVDEPLEPEW